MPLKRNSYHLSRLQNELRKHALSTDDDELRSQLWRYYYKARNAEHEIREMVMDAEMRRLLDFVFPNGIPSDIVNDSQKPPPEIESPDDDDKPQQHSLWD